MCQTLTLNFEKDRPPTTTKACDPQLPCRGESTWQAVTWGMLVFSNHYTNREEEVGKTEGGVLEGNMLTCSNLHSLLFTCLTDLTSINLQSQGIRGRLPDSNLGWVRKKSQFAFCSTDPGLVGRPVLHTVHNLKSTHRRCIRICWETVDSINWAHTHMHSTLKQQGDMVSCWVLAVAQRTFLH